MDIELLYFDDCPSWRVAEQHLAQLANEIQGVTIRRVIVDTPEAAREHRFLGSPSIHVDGSDLFAEPEAPYGLCCRIYQTPDGSAGSPTFTQIADAISARSSR